jgi:hypothetical protein
LFWGSQTLRARSESSEAANIKIKISGLDMVSVMRIYHGKKKMKSNKGKLDL